MNYGVQTETTEGSGDIPQSAAPTSSNYENYLKYYHEAGQDRMLSRPKKDVVKEDTHDEMVEKLQQLESSIQQGTTNVLILGSHMFFHALTFALSKGRCLNTRLWPSVKKSADLPAKSECNETNMCDRYSCIFYLIPIKFVLKTLLKHLNIPFLTLDFSKKSGISVKLLNIIASPQGHKRAQTCSRTKARAK